MVTWQTNMWQQLILFLPHRMNPITWVCQAGIWNNCWKHVNKEFTKHFETSFLILRIQSTKTPQKLLNALPGGITEPVGDHPVMKLNVNLSNDVLVAAWPRNIWVELISLASFQEPCHEIWHKKSPILCEQTGELALGFKLNVGPQCALVGSTLHWYYHSCSGNNRLKHLCNNVKVKCRNIKYFRDSEWTKMWTRLKHVIFAT